MGIGGAMIKFAYIGTIARYSAGEIAPVAKDTFNYVAKGSAEGVSAIVQAIKQSLLKKRAIALKIASES